MWDISTTGILAGKLRWFRGKFFYFETQLRSLSLSLWIPKGCIVVCDIHSLSHTTGSRFLMFGIMVACFLFHNLINPFLLLVRPSHFDGFLCHWWVYSDHFKYDIDCRAFSDHLLIFDNYTRPLMAAVRWLLKLFTDCKACDSNLSHIVN